MKNIVSLAGTVTNITEAYNYTNNQDGHKDIFYQLMIKVPRLSDMYDVLPVIVSDKLLIHTELKEDMYVAVTGNIRTRNYEENGRKHLQVYCYAEDIDIIEKQEYERIQDKNIVAVEGYLCKRPTYREMKSGRVISDMLLAVNRNIPSKGIVRSSYVPCIAWGLNAKAASKLHVGDIIGLNGRFQSRKFRRKEESGYTENIAYEISIANFAVFEKPKEEKPEVKTTVEEEKLLA